MEGLKMRSKKVTIDDIARLTQVSKTTISRYLNGKFEYMSEETKKRIKEAIELLQYQPSNIARSLKNNKSMLVGLVIADIESPFSSAVIKSIGDAMKDAGYNIIVVNCDNKWENEEAYIRSLIAQQVDGLIVNTTKAVNPYLIRLANDGVPIVLIDRMVKDYNFDIAYIDCEKPIYDAVDHLLDMGYSTPAIFVEAPYEEISPRYLRVEYFIKKLRSLGWENPEQYVFEVDRHTEGSIGSSINKLLNLNEGKSGPPAIIATNGVTLINVAKEVNRQGLRMPYDIGLCGYDEWGWVSEMGWADLIDVGLTTICPSIHALGEKTANMLIKRMEYISTPKEQFVVSAPLIVRQSTCLKNNIIKNASSFKKNKEE